jgi:hypothetical protein
MDLGNRPKKVTEGHVGGSVPQTGQVDLRTFYCERVTCAGVSWQEHAQWLRDESPRLRFVPTGSAGRGKRQAALIQWRDRSRSFSGEAVVGVEGVDAAKWELDPSSEVHTTRQNGCRGS